MSVRLLLMLGVAATLLAQPDRPIKPNKKEKEPVTQALPTLPDPPAAVAAETARLVFHSSPLSAKGLLSQQVRDALKALDRDNRGAQIVKLRAFVAGTGDSRRVQQIVSEMFSEKKQPLPALTTVLVGALPLEGAQVVIESVGVDKRTLNPDGLSFYPPQPAESLAAAANIVRVTCFMNSFDKMPQFPGAAVTFVQLTRAGGGGPALCEAVARGRATSGGAGGGAISFMGPKIILSGLQMAFRDQDDDVRLALGRLQKAVEPLGGRLPGAGEGSAVSIYGLSKAAAERARGLAGGGVPLVFEGLPSLDAVVGLDVVSPMR